MNKMISVRLCFLAALLAFSGPIYAQKEDKDAQGAAVSSVSKDAIAVMPFSALGGDKWKWLGMGFAESVSARLSKVHGITLVERAQLDAVIKEMALGQSGLVEDATAVKAGQLVGAGRLVVGSVQIMGEGNDAPMRVVVKQTATATSVVVEGSGETFDGKFGDVFSLQDKIAEKVAMMLVSKLSDEELKGLRIHETSSIAAYEIYNLSKSETDMARRETLLRKAIELDPDYGFALLDLGTLLYMTNYSNPHNEEIAMKLEAALKSDSQLFSANLVLGDCYERRATAYRRAKDPKAAEMAKKATENYEAFIKAKEGSTAKLVKSQVDRAKSRMKMLASP